MALSNDLEGGGRVKRLAIKFKEIGLGPLYPLALGACRLVPREPLADGVHLMTGVTGVTSVTDATRVAGVTDRLAST